MCYDWILLYVQNDRKKYVILRRFADEESSSLTVASRRFDCQDGSPRSDRSGLAMKKTRSRGEKTITIHGFAVKMDCHVPPRPELSGLVAKGYRRSFP